MAEIIICPAICMSEQEYKKQVKNRKFETDCFEISFTGWDSSGNRKGVNPFSSLIRHNGRKTISSDLIRDDEGNDRKNYVEMNLRFAGDFSGSMPPARGVFFGRRWKDRRNTFCRGMKGAP